MARMTLAQFGEALAAVEALGFITTKGKVDNHPHYLIDVVVIKSPAKARKVLAEARQRILEGQERVVYLKSRGMELNPKYTNALNAVFCAQQVEKYLVEKFGL